MPGKGPRFKMSNWFVIVSETKLFFLVRMVDTGVLVLNSAELLFFLVIPRNCVTTPSAITGVSGALTSQQRPTEWRQMLVAVFNNAESDAIFFCPCHL